MENDKNDITVYARGRVALILAASLGLFLIVFTGFAMYEAGNPEATISENATQLLAAALGGIIGVLAGYVGGVEAGQRAVRGNLDIDEEEIEGGHDADSDPEVEDEIEPITELKSDTR